MITRGDLRFNCCESVAMMVNEKHPLPGFDAAAMRIASNLGGGIAGWGEICGAVTGAAWPSASPTAQTATKPNPHSRR